VSRILAQVLSVKEPYFSHAIQDLERLSGNHSHDVRVISDIVHTQKNVLQELGLDQHDTTPKELFFALRHRALQTESELQRAIGITDAETPLKTVEKIITFIDSLSVNRNVWAVKGSVIKSLLKEQPPKKLMKVLGVRSVDSMLKRSSPCEILALSYEFENSEWTQKFHARFKNLQPSDFQETKSQLYILAPARAEKLRKAGYRGSRIIVPNYETGTVLIVPPKTRFGLDVLALTLAILQTLYELRVYGAYFRHLAVQPSFGVNIASVLKHGLPGSIQSATIGWRVLQRHFNQHPRSFDLVEQPHLHYDDVTVTPPSEALAQALPSMKFWNAHKSACMQDGTFIVSAHPLDVITGGSNGLQYGTAHHHHLRLHVWENLASRYLQHHPVQVLVLNKIDNRQRSQV
jgi:hypothetical protein